MKIRAKFVGGKVQDTAFQDDEFPASDGQFVVDKIYEFSLMGMTLYPPMTGLKIVRYSSIASFLRNWDEIKVIEP